MRIYRPVVILSALTVALIPVAVAWGIREAEAD